MSPSAIERLRIPPSLGLTRDPWGLAVDQDPLPRIVAAAGLSGTVLPPTKAYRGVVVPVIRWDLNALADRLRHGSGPIIERAKVAASLERGQPSVVTIMGYVSLRPWSRCRADLSALSVYARAVLAVPREQGSCVDRLECDARGISVVSVGESSADLEVQGHAGPDPRCRPVPVQHRLMSEQLYDVACRSGLVPPL